jgi:hypothetical protein
MASVRVGGEGTTAFPQVKKQRCAEAFIVGPSLGADELIVVNLLNNFGLKPPLIA